METTTFNLFVWFLLCRFKKLQATILGGLLNQPPKQIQLNYLSRSASEELNQNKLLMEDG